MGLFPGHTACVGGTAGIYFSDSFSILLKKFFSDFINNTKILWLNNTKKYKEEMETY